MSDESEDEFLEDFGSPRLSEAEIDRLLARARASSDLELRRLIKEVRMWRWFAPQFLDRLVPGGSPSNDGDALLRMARFIVQGAGETDR